MKRPAPTTTGNLVSMVGAAYAVDASAQDWGARLLDAMERTVRGGIGGFACTFAWEAQSSFRFDMETAVSLGVPNAVLATILDGLGKMPPRWMHERLMRQQGTTFCIMTSEADKHAELEYRAALVERGIPDGVNLVGLDLNQRGFLISLGVPPSYALTPRMRTGLRRAGAHVLAALRLRARLAVTGTEARGAATAATSGDGTGDTMPAPAPEAILTPTGKLLHAEGAAALGRARRALQAATQHIEALRATAVDDDLEALASWKGLVASRWTLVDSFERNGERYVVARENLPQGRGPEALTDTERIVLTYVARGCSTKQAAYALGISDSTVRVLLMRAARRCGARDRSQLLELWRHHALPST